MREPLPGEQCERMNRHEFEAMRDLLGAASFMASALDKLKGHRLELLDKGKFSGERWLKMVLGGVRAITNSLLKTLPEGQRKQMRNTMQDMEIRIVPKATPMPQNVVLEREVMESLVDATRSQMCSGCVEDEKSCQKCGLYKALESFLPLDDYDGGMLCPYSLAEWGERQ